MTRPIEPTPDQVRAVKLELAAIARGWAAVNEEDAETAFHDFQRHSAARLAASQNQAASEIEYNAIHPRQRPVSQSAADAVTVPTQPAQDGDGTPDVEAPRATAHDVEGGGQ